MQSVYVRTRPAAVVFAAVIALLSILTATPASPVPVRSQFAFAPGREPGQPPLERRLRSLIRRFIGTVLGELDVPHP